MSCVAGISRDMAPRTRKFVGIFILLPYLGAYMFAAAALAERLPDHWLADLVYFAAAGVIWVFPVMRLMRWMNADPGAAP